MNISNKWYGGIWNLCDVWNIQGDTHEFVIEANRFIFYIAFDNI